ncbi:MAG: hypothetical protein AABX54_01370 [Nanoarchaeota archaeon]
MEQTKIIDRTWRSNPPYNPKSLEDFFEKAGRGPVFSGGYSAEQIRMEKILNSARKLKRRLLGLCGTTATKSVEEVADALTKLGVSRGSDESPHMAESLDGRDIVYWVGRLHGPLIFVADDRIPENVDYMRFVKAAKDRFRIYVLNENTSQFGDDFVR